MNPRKVSLQILAHLDSAKKAADRVGQPDQADALHDFRVNLRRARSLLKVYRPLLKKAHPKKMLRKLKKIADATNLARDLEVDATWLNRNRGASPGNTKSEFDRQRTRVENMLKNERKRTEENLRPEFERVYKKCRKWLNKFLENKPSGTLPAHGMEIADGRLRFDLRYKLAIARYRWNEAALHALRIAVKRYRYFLESGNGNGSNQALLTQLKAWQDNLGEFHDLCILQKRLSLNKRNHALIIKALQKDRERLNERLRPLIGRHHRGFLMDAALLQHPH